MIEHLVLTADPPCSETLVDVFDAVMVNEGHSGSDREIPLGRSN